jgi:hypothetical protein
MCLPDAAGTWSVPIHYFIALNNNIINTHLQFNLCCGLGDLETVFLLDSASKPLLFNTQFNLLHKFSGTTRAASTCILCSLFDITMFVFGDTQWLVIYGHQFLVISISELV